MSKVELKDEERTRCEVWTRVMGYHRPVQAYNVGKKQEFKDRKYFTEAQTVKHIGEGWDGATRNEGYDGWDKAK